MFTVWYCCYRFASEEEGELIGEELGMDEGMHGEHADAFEEGPMEAVM